MSVLILACGSALAYMLQHAVAADCLCSWQTRPTLTRAAWLHLHLPLQGAIAADILASSILTLAWWHALVPALQWRTQTTLHWG